MAVDVWSVGPDGVVHFAFSGAGWACARGKGGATIGDATPGSATPFGACTDCLAAINTKAREAEARRAADDAWAAATTEPPADPPPADPPVPASAPDPARPDVAVDLAFADSDEPAFDPDLVQGVT